MAKVVPYHPHKQEHFLSFQLNLLWDIRKQYVHMPHMLGSKVHWL